MLHDKSPPEVADTEGILILDHLGTIRWLEIWTFKQD